MLFVLSSYCGRLAFWLLLTQSLGTLIDGTEFDSSYKRGKTATFGVTQVIKGWTEALQLSKSTLMDVGNT